MVTVVVITILRLPALFFLVNTLLPITASAPSSHLKSLTSYSAMTIYMQTICMQH
jgi:hypothetical protein